MFIITAENHGQVAINESYYKLLSLLENGKY